MNFETFQQSTIKFIWYVVKQKPWAMTGAFVMVLAAVVAEGFAMRAIKNITDAISHAQPINEV